MIVIYWCWNEECFGLDQYFMSTIEELYQERGILHIGVFFLPERSKRSSTITRNL